MEVRLVDLAAQYASIRPTIDAAIMRVARSGGYAVHEVVGEFEDAWARYCGAQYAVGVGSCSDALFLTLRYLHDALRAREVVTTPMSFWATSEAALRAGLRVQYRDIGPDGCMMILPPVPMMSQGVVPLPVNLYGYPAPCLPDAVEDAAQSHGIPLRGWASCASFYPTKNLGAMGQAGAVVTNDVQLRDWVRMARSHSEAVERFRHWGVTGNLRMDPLQASILLAKLPHLNEWTERRRGIAALYRQHLAGLEPHITLLPHHPQHVYHIFGIRLRSRELRTSLADWLHVRGVQTGVRYPIALHLQPYWQGRFKRGAFPQAEAWADEVINLPIHEMMLTEQALYVTSQVRLWCEALDPARLREA